MREKGERREDKREGRRVGRRLVQLQEPVQNGLSRTKGGSLRGSGSASLENVTGRGRRTFSRSPHADPSEKQPPEYDERCDAYEGWPNAYDVFARRVVVVVASNEEDGHGDRRAKGVARDAKQTSRRALHSSALRYDWTVTKESEESR